MGDQQYEPLGGNMGGAAPMQNVPAAGIPPPPPMAADPNQYEVPQFPPGGKPPAAGQSPCVIKKNANFKRKGINSGKENSASTDLRSAPATPNEANDEQQKSEKNGSDKQTKKKGKKAAKSSKTDGGDRIYSPMRLGTMIGFSILIILLGLLLTGAYVYFAFLWRKN